MGFPGSTIDDIDLEEVDEEEEEDGEAETNGDAEDEGIFEMV